MQALDVIYRPGFAYKKAGVMLLDLGPAGDVQGGLFDRPDDPRAVARMAAMDALNRKFGRDTVTYAVTGRKRPWKLRTAFISPRYNHTMV